MKKGHGYLETGLLPYTEKVFLVLMRDQNQLFAYIGVRRLELEQMHCFAHKRVGGHTENLPQQL